LAVERWMRRTPLRRFRRGKRSSVVFPEPFRPTQTQPVARIELKRDLREHALACIREGDLVQGDQHGRAFLSQRQGLLLRQRPNRAEASHVRSRAAGDFVLQGAPEAAYSEPARTRGPGLFHPRSRSNQAYKPAKDPCRRKIRPADVQGGRGGGPGEQVEQGRGGAGPFRGPEAGAARSMPVTFKDYDAVATRWWDQQIDLAWIRRLQAINARLGGDGPGQADKAREGLLPGPWSARGPTRPTRAWWRSRASAPRGSRRQPTGYLFPMALVAKAS